MSVVVAGVVQLAAVLWLLRRSGYSVMPRLRPVEPGIAPVLSLMAPVVLGMGFLQISPLFDNIIIWIFSATDHSPTMTIAGRVFDKPLSEGTLMHVYAARRLYQLPMGVLAISLGVAVFPLFSRYAARGDMQNLRYSLNRALRLASMEGIACGAGLWILARPITAIIYERGKYTAADVDASADVLRMYVLGMWAYCTYQIIAKAFFAIKEPKTPMKVSCFLMVVNMLLVAMLIWVPSLDAAALGLATSITASASVVILAVILRLKLGRLGGRRIAASVARSMICCLAMLGTIYGLMKILNEYGDLVVVAVCVPAGIVVFIAIAAALRMTELAEVAGPMIAKFKSNPKQANAKPSTKV